MQLTTLHPENSQSPSHAQFPCDVSANVSDINDRVKNVWTLGPRNIDIVASLGDSITAGTGSKAENIFGVLNENRGSSYMTGADEDWNSCPTIHNFIREFNPNVMVKCPFVCVVFMFINYVLSYFPFILVKYINGIFG